MYRECDGFSLSKNERLEPRKAYVLAGVHIVPATAAATVLIGAACRVAVLPNGPSVGLCGSLVE